jgi:hypothetical protein
MESAWLAVRKTQVACSLFFRNVAVIAEVFLAFCTYFLRLLLRRQKPPPDFYSSYTGV